MFCKEVTLWNTLKHPNVLSLTGVPMERNQFVTVSEWTGHENIMQYIRQNHVGRLELVSALFKLLGSSIDHGHGSNSFVLLRVPSVICTVYPWFMGTLKEYVSQRKYLTSV